LALLLLSAVSTFALGTALVAGSPAIGNTLLSVAGSLLATAVLAIFFNLPDTANYVSKTVARLIATGSVVDLLSPAARAQMLQRVQLARIQHDAKAIADDLENVVRERLDGYLSGPYLSNYRYSLEIRPDPNDPRLVMTTCSISYRAHGAHLQRERQLFPVAYNFQWEVDELCEAPPVEWVADFSAEIGDKRFDKGAMKVLAEVRNGKLHVAGEFKHIAQLDDKVDVKIRVTSRSTESDPVDAMFFKYPVRGFLGQLVYDESRELDCCVFRSCKSGDLSMNAGSPEKRERSIGFDCLNEWALPGEGFAFFFPRRNGRSG
jgi:hypothetical protein